MQSSESPTVMIADDYDDVRAILRRWLETKGYRDLQRFRLAYSGLILFNQKHETIPLGITPTHRRRSR